MLVKVKVLRSYIIKKYTKGKVINAYETGALMQTISNRMAGTESGECMQYNRYAIRPFSVGLVFTTFKLLTNRSAKDGIPVDQYL